MARNVWNIYKDIADVWTADGTIYRPNENLELTLNATQARIDLADGSRSYMTPETKYNKESLLFRWLEIENTDTFWSKIETYVQTQDYLKIIDHLSNEYIGRFISIRRIWLSGVIDTYDFEAVFERME
jgi:hypothetical protein